MSGMSFRDPLTQAYSRAYFEEVFHREISRANRAQRGFALLIVDVDHFKGINSRQGKSAGNRCLKKLARLITDNVRSGDVVARYGPDEFVILMEECRPLDAIQCAHRILDRVEGSAEKDRFTVSVGLLHYQGISNVLRTDTILSRTQKMTARAKSQGGNCLMVAA